MASRKIIRWLILAAAISAPVSILPLARAAVFVAVNIAPPPLPVYAQPICPGEGFLWTPGYWAYGPEGYFWVPGTWVRPPRIGYLWTPAYWGYEGSGYIFHGGYWGQHVGFYGGINYGFGYGGYGYEGGYWRGNSFAYNRAVNNINVNVVRNVYERPVPLLNGAYNHVSYNGGNGGVPYRASQQELFAAEREQHLRPTPDQLQHQSFAAQNRQQFARYNNGRPAIAAAPFPGALRSNPGNQTTPGTYPGQNLGNLSGTRNGFPNQAAPGRAYQNPSAARGGFGANNQGRAFNGAAAINRQPRYPSATARPQSPPFPGRQNTSETYRNGFSNSRTQPQLQQRQRIQPGAPQQLQGRPIQPQYQQRQQPENQQRQPQMQQMPRQQPMSHPDFQPRAAPPSQSAGPPEASQRRH